MKRNKLYGIGLALVALVLCATGCATVKRAIFKEQVSQEQVVTEVDEVVEMEPGVLVTNLVKATNWVAVTNYVPRSAVTGTVDLIASNSGVPGGGLIGTAFAAILTGIGGWMSRKRRDGKTIESLVQGFEEGRRVLGEELTAMKDKGEVPDPGSVDAKVLRAMKAVHKHTGHVAKIRPVVDKVRAVLGK